MKRFFLPAAISIMAVLLWWGIPIGYGIWYSWWMYYDIKPQDNKLVLSREEQEAQLEQDRELLRNIRASLEQRPDLHKAAWEGKADVVRTLINRGANINVKDDFGKTALYIAAEEGHADIVRILIYKGANVNEKDDNGSTPLMAAAMQGEREIAELLIEKGARVNVKDKNGQTPLHIAAGQKDAKVSHDAIVRLLIREGAKVNEKDNNGWTALSLATDTFIIETLKSAEKEHMAVARQSAPEPTTKANTKAEQVPDSDSIVTQNSSHAQPSQASKQTPADIDRIIPKTNKRNLHAIAIVIGNRDYKNRDVPSVDYAVNDAESVKKYLINVLGYKDGNVIFLKDATKAEFEAHFGNKDDHKGILYNYLKPGKSDIFVYYSGHGAPDIESKKGYFVPSDANPQAIKLSGYPIDTLYANLAKTAKEMSSPNVFIVIDACFSGATEKGLLMKNASPITVTVSNPLQQIPNAVVMTSSSASEISSWYPENGHSMFTYFLLKSLKDNASKPGLTAGDLFSAVSDGSEGVPYYARRMYGRSQTPQITGDKGRVLIGR